jgi:mono/diheme cytochrome c family protein
MQQHSESTSSHFFPVKTIAVTAIILLVIAATTSAFKEENNVAGSFTKYNNINQDSVESVQAFMQVYTVLMNPRCMNCHPSGDRPLQGDDSHIHTMNVQRGKDGQGLYALKCSNCHQPQNAEAMHAPPGNPKWQLPPANMKMVFQGKSAHELALQIMDYNKNGHKNKEQLLEHANDGLVKDAWNMGAERKPPSLSYEAFHKAWNTWIEKGGYAPPQK